MNAKNKKAAIDPREDAKKAVIETASTDNELTDTLSSAHNYQLELKKEDNSHQLKILEKEKGTLGVFIGDRENATALIAFIAVLLGFCSAVYFYIEKNDEAANKCMAFSLTALGFIFGRSTS